MVPATKAQIIARSLKNTISQLTYPMYQLIIQIAEKYTAATAADWTNLDGVSAAPVTQDAAIEILVDAVGSLQANDPDSIITAQGDLIVGDASADGARLAKGAEHTIPAATATTVAYKLLTDANIDASAAIATSKLAGASATSVGVDKIKKYAVAVYDFTVDGSALGVPLGVTIPAGAVVSEVIQDVVVPLNSTSGTTTVTINLIDDGAITTALTANNAAGVASKEVVTPLIKASQPREVTLIAGVDDLTAGKIRFFITYFESTLV